MKNLPIVMRIARVIRREAELLHEGWGGDPKHIDLGGWCAHSSNVLFQELLRRGIQSKLVWNELHCFVTYGPYIVDITATQFGRYNKVELRPRQLVEDLNTDWWEEEDRISNLKEYHNNNSWACLPNDSYNDEWYERVRPRLKAMRIR